MNPMERQLDTPLSSKHSALTHPHIPLPTSTPSSVDPGVSPEEDIIAWIIEPYKTVLRAIGLAERILPVLFQKVDQQAGSRGESLLAALEDVNIHLFQVFHNLRGQLEARSLLDPELIAPSSTSLFESQSIENFPLETKLEMLLLLVQQIIIAIPDTSQCRLILTDLQKACSQASSLAQSMEWA